MLGLLLIYFIGKYFADLAEQHEQHKWLYAILGVLSYYAGTFLAGILIAIGLELLSEASIDEMSDIALSFMALPFGLLACWGFYQFLKRKWSQVEVVADSGLLDDELLHP